MKGWIIFKDRKANLTEANDYEALRLLDATANFENLKLEVYEPSQFEIIVKNKNPKIYIDGIETSAPDFIMPHLSKNFSNHYFEILPQLESACRYMLNGYKSIEDAVDKFKFYLK